jgi:hypothetical protein
MYETLPQWCYHQSSRTWHIFLELASPPLTWWTPYLKDYSSCHLTRIQFPQCYVREAAAWSLKTGGPLCSLVYYQPKYCLDWTFKICLSQTRLTLVYLNLDVAINKLGMVIYHYTVNKRLNMRIVYNCKLFSQQLLLF